MSLSDKRKAAGVTQEFLAKKLNVTQQAVARWETGKAYPRASMLPKIASVLGCTVDELLCEQ